MFGSKMLLVSIISSTFQTMVLPTTLYKYFLFDENAISLKGPWISEYKFVQYMIKASKEEGVDGEGSCIKAYNLWVLG